MHELTLNQTNHINSGLMVLSALAAWLLPFEVFLISYAILGPLHYFTEISWLHDRQYFMPNKRYSAPLYGLTLAALIVTLIPSINFQGIVFIAFSFAILVALAPSPKLLAPGLAIITVLSYWASQVPLLILIFSILLPTLIHVCLFTAIFLLLGSLKNASQSGYFSCFVYLCCGTAVLLMPEQLHYQTSQSTLESITSFLNIAEHLNNILGREQLPDTLVAAFRFIAFVYTYHYLNWFSKTNILQWHRMSKQRIGLIASLWLASIALYAFDYKMGLLVLFFFSMLHVILEFPLNIQSITNLYQESKKRLALL